MSERVTLTIPKLPALLRLLRGNDLYAGPWKDALEDIGQVNEQIAIARAPMASGQTISKMSHKVQNKPVPLYVVVKTTARNPRNRYLYPRRIEYGKRSSRYGWFRSAFNTAALAWPGLLDKAAGKIGALWRQGF